jgi:hypothetical protein
MSQNGRGSFSFGHKKECYKEEDKASTESFLRKPSPSPSPCPCTTEGDEPPVVEWLLESHQLDGLRPRPVELPPLPAKATPTMKAVAEFYKLVRGLRLLDDDERPVPFACRWVAKHTGLSAMSVSRALRQLVSFGVLKRAGTLDRRDDLLRGTCCFLPGDPVGIERRAELIAGQVVEPEPVVIDESLVETAVRGQSGVERARAARNRTGSHGSE